MLSRVTAALAKLLTPIAKTSEPKRPEAEQKNQKESSQEHSSSSFSSQPQKQKQEQEKKAPKKKPHLQVVADGSAPASPSAQPAGLGSTTTEMTDLLNLGKEERSTLARHQGKKTYARSERTAKDSKLEKGSMINRKAD
ncbi:MAG: hypothetical protein ACO3A2_00405 [Bdellovibrionia bacterium]